MNLLKRAALGLTFFLIIAAVILLTVAHPATQPAFLSKTADRPLIIAHKGGDGLVPGNTLQAFVRGVEEGSDILETDARLTADGQVVLFHDARLDDLTDGVGSVEASTLAELGTLDAAYNWTPNSGETYPYRGKGLRIPTLEEALMELPNARFNIDMKTHTPEMVEALARVIEATGAQQRVLVTSFDDATVKAFRERMPAVASSLASNEVRLLWGLQLLRLQRLYSPPAPAVQVPEYEGSLRVVSQHFVAAAQSRGMQVHVWTVNDPAAMRRLLELGVDGIITDYPNVLREVIHGLTETQGAHRSVPGSAQKE